MYTDTNYTWNSSHSTKTKLLLRARRNLQSHATLPTSSIIRNTSHERLLSVKPMDSDGIQPFNSSIQMPNYCSLIWLPAIIEDPFISIDDMYARMICLDRYFLYHQDYMLHFNNIYLEMTRLVREKILSGTYFELPEWMKGYTVRFGNFYRDALLKSRRGDIDKVPRAWRLAFEHARLGDMPIFINFALGMGAHIVHDLGIALSELDPAGMNSTTKKSDSEKINGIIHNCSFALETALIEFYAPVVNLDPWRTLIKLALNILTDTLRNIAWKEGIFMATHPMASESLIHIMDIAARFFGDILVIVGHLFKVLTQYERSFPFEHYCKISPWGCADNNE